MGDACHIGALYPCRLQRPWSPLSTGTRSPILDLGVGLGWGEALGLLICVILGR